MTEKSWTAETLHEAVQVSYATGRVLHEETGEQQLRLFENPRFGKMLMLDGAVQVTTGDEFIYHEMMAHVPLLEHGAARDVLIIGGGDCGLAEEVLKHETVASLTLVEIDASVVAFSRTHFVEFNAPVFADPRFSLEITDGTVFVAKTERRFDVILVDSTDPVGPGAVLFTERFYADLKRCLRPGGIVVTQAGVPFMQRPSFVSGMAALSRVFTDAACYVIAVPSYFGGHMALGWARQDDSESAVADEETLVRRAEGLDTHYYTPQVHRAAFALPRFIAEALDEARQAGASAVAEPKQEPTI